MPKKSVQRVSKPWGHELIWAHTQRYAGKILHVNAGQSLSYQYHRFKEETMYLVSGEIRLEHETDGVRQQTILLPGEAFDIPVGTKHRVVAIKESDIFEVSSPELDDVVRLEDQYGRTGK